MDDAVRAEVNNYLQLKVDAMVDDDPLLFWRNAQQLDHLKRVAKNGADEKCIICRC